jgi:hypothetical protein
LRRKDIYQFIELTEYSLDICFVPRLKLSLPRKIEKSIFQCQSWVENASFSPLALCRLECPSVPQLVSYCLTGAHAIAWWPSVSECYPVLSVSQQV